MCEFKESIYIYIYIGTLRLDGVRFRRMDEQDNAMLISRFSKEEVRQTCWECDGNKCSGPHGFNFHFIKKNVAI